MPEFIGISRIAARCEIDLSKGNVTVPLKFLEVLILILDILYLKLILNVV